VNDRLSFEGLRYAQAVARTGSFSAAAREYDVTQPALSNAIRRLEKILGARLFERNTRGARPTVFGATILPRIDAALAALDAITAEVVAGRLRMASDVFDPEPLPDDYPLWQADNAFISPHIGGNTTAMRPRMVRLLADQLPRLTDGREFMFVVKS